MLLEPLGELLVRDALDERADLGVAELRLGLAFELRAAQLHGDDRREALADVLAEQVLVLLLEVTLLAGITVQHVGEGLLEALFVHPAFGRRDVVGEGVEAFVVARVPLQRELGFAVVEKDSLPLKVWSDCVRCPKRDGCDEIAMVRELMDVPIAPGPVATPTPRGVSIPVLDHLDD